MSRERRQFTKEFKEEACRLVQQEGMSGKQVCKDLDLGYSTLVRWLREYRNGGKSAFPGRGNLKPEDDRFRELEKENRRLRMERDILKKAIAFISEVPK